jgi:hypothetical protein
MRRLQMRKGFIHITPFIPLLLVFPCAGCLSLVEQAGRVLDGSAFAEKTVALYRTPKSAGPEEAMEIRELRSRAGERSIGITLNRFPAMTIRGSAPGEGGIFFLTSLEYLGSSVAGWNEYTLDISGSGTLALGETEAEMRILQPPEAAEISRGRIHRYDTRITGEEALTSLRGRRDRIAALAEWMRAREDAPAGLNRKDFEKYWKPVLLPEMTGNNRRPEGWRHETDQWVRAEDIRWNTGYTARVFPEELRAVRDSGTLLRDWEEAPGWIYLEYEWERIGELLSRKNTLQRIK